MASRALPFPGPSAQACNQHGFGEVEMSPVGEGDEDVLTAQQTVEVKVRSRISRAPLRQDSTRASRLAPASLQWSLSGDRERLKQEARQRLEEAGWTDELRQLCRGASCFTHCCCLLLIINADAPPPPPLKEPCRRVVDQLACGVAFQNLPPAAAARR